MKYCTLKEHIAELRFKLLVVFFTFVIAFSVCYYFSDSIYNFLLQPLAKITKTNNKSIIYTGLAEAFITYIKLSAFSAFMLITPVIALQIYLFISPGLYQNEKKLAVILLFFSVFLFWIGAGFVFYLVIPKAWHFFLSFENTDLIIPITLQAKVSEYVNLVIQLIIIFGLAFQLPILFLILNMLGLIEVATLKRKRRLAIVVIFIIAGILTPPDVLSQFALAIPLLLLYEISIVLCRFFNTKGTNA